MVKGLIKQRKQRKGYGNERKGKGFKVLEVFRNLFIPGIFCHLLDQE